MKYLPVIAILIALVFAGCVQPTQPAEPTTTPEVTPVSTPAATPDAPPLIGGDKDEHGCIGSAGYTWCEPKQKCLREWEEPCEEPLIGGDKDEHGCIGSAGYTWCESSQKCLRPWEEPCNDTMMPGSDKDEHGCIGSAGYQWCESKSKCLRIWEEDCPDIDSGNVTVDANATADMCVAAGGTVGTAMCCGAVGDFPNTCLIGACGCAPDYSHEVSVCECPDDKCWDGTNCTVFNPQGV